MMNDHTSEWIRVELVNLLNGIVCHVKATVNVYIFVCVNCLGI